MMYMDMEGYVVIFFMLVLGYMAAWCLIECFIKPTFYWIKNSYKERKSAKIPTITMDENPNKSLTRFLETLLKGFLYSNKS